MTGVGCASFPTTHLVDCAQTVVRPAEPLRPVSVDLRVVINGVEESQGDSGYVNWLEERLAGILRDANAFSDVSRGSGNPHRLVMVYDVEFSEILAASQALSAISLFVIPGYYKERVTLSVDHVDGSEVLGRYEYAGCIHNVFGLPAILCLGASIDQERAALRLQKTMISNLACDIENEEGRDERSEVRPPDSRISD